jgi:hypothetical protein
MCSVVDSASLQQTLRSLAAPWQQRKTQLTRDAATDERIEQELFCSLTPGGHNMDRNKIHQLYAPNHTCAIQLAQKSV